MDCVYRTSDRAIAQLLASALETHEIGAIVDGEHLSPLQGLAVPAGASAEYRVCIVDPEQRPRAERFVREWLEQQVAPQAEGWTCRSCGEAHGGQFSSCWSCGAERDAPWAGGGGGAGPGRDADPVQRERALQTWELRVSAVPDERLMETLRRVVGFKRFELEALRRRLPGPVRRGARTDLEPLEAALRRAGVACELRRRAPAGREP